MVAGVASLLAQGGRLDLLTADGGDDEGTALLLLLLVQR